MRAGLAAGTIISTALAADTISITIMEVIDNLVVVLFPGALDAGIDEPLVYASIAAGFAVAYPFTFLANRYMVARGKGHARVHAHHGHLARSPDRTRPNRGSAQACPPSLHFERAGRGEPLVLLHGVHATGQITRGPEQDDPLDHRHPVSIPAKATSGA